MIICISNLNKYVLFSIFFFIILCSPYGSIAAQYKLPTQSQEHSAPPSWLQSTQKRLKQIWNTGQQDIYVSGYAWHNRAMYTLEKSRSYNETAWGGGVGKSLFDEKGNWHSLALIAFLDSHKEMEPAGGYTYLKVISWGERVKLGGGFSFLITARSDLYNGYPFPGLLPWVSFFFHKIALSATYIPGSKNNGNVLYMLGKITID